jgi:RNA polymerase-binding transcription factor DksA
MELSLELLERDENTVREIMDALERVKDGTYGKCEVCEKWIRKTRLSAVPHARNCIDCQRAAEADAL